MKLPVLTDIHVDETGAKCDGCAHLGSLTLTRRCGLFGDVIDETSVPTGRPFPNAYRTEYARTSRCIAAVDAALGARRDGVVAGLRRAMGVALALDEGEAGAASLPFRKALLGTIDSILNGGPA